MFQIKMDKLFKEMSNVFGITDNILVEMNMLIMFYVCHLCTEMGNKKLYKMPNTHLKLPTRLLLYLYYSQKQHGVHGETVNGSLNQFGP